MASPLFDTPDVCHMLGIHQVTSAARAAFAAAKSPRASAAKNVSTICVLSSTSIGHSPRLWRGAALKSQQLCSTERNGRRYIPAAHDQLHERLLEPLEPAFRAPHLDQPQLPRLHPDVAP